MTTELQRYKVEIGKSTHTAPYICDLIELKERFNSSAQIVKINNPFLA